MFFSIVIPAYNAEEYIERCINSILRETFIDYEIIIVDDGSTDQTFKFIESYSNKHDSIKAYKKINSGVSAARNFGMKKSIGEYLIFLDSDDWINPGYLSFLYDNLVNRDVDGVVLGFINNDGVNEEYSCYFKSDEIISADTYRNLFVKGNISNTPWDKVFKRELYINNDINFPEKISIGEDAVVSATLGLHSEKIYLCQSAFVNYMQDTNGVTTRNKTMSHVADLHKSLEMIIDRYEGLIPKSELSKMYMVKLYNIIRNSCYTEFNKSVYRKKYQRHVDNIRYYEFNSLYEVIRYFPLWLFSKLNIIPAYAIYDTFFKNAKKFKKSLKL